MIRNENAERKMQLSDTVTLSLITDMEKMSLVLLLVLLKPEILNLWLCSALYVAVILPLGEENGIEVIQDYESFFTLCN